MTECEHEYNQDVSCMICKEKVHIDDLLYMHMRDIEIKSWNFCLDAVEDDLEKRGYGKISFKHLRRGT